MRKAAIILIGAGLILLGATGIFKDAYGKNISGTAEAIAVSLVATKINQSLNSGIYSKELDGPLIEAERDEEGNIKYLQPNSRLINKLVLAFSMGVKENYSLGDIKREKVNLGVLTGSKLLSQLPFTATVRIQPLSLTKFQCETEFETEGINQTRYFVYCTIESQIRILAPFTNKTAQINRKVLLAEAVIVGQVPDNYVMVPEDNILDAIE